MKRLRQRLYTFKYFRCDTMAKQPALIKKGFKWATDRCGTSQGKGVLWTLHRDSDPVY